MRAETSAVVLAAGSSTRMGTGNKLLLPIGGLPMVRRVVTTCREATERTVHVVLGHDAERVAAALDGLDVALLRNFEYAGGQVTSVRCGLRAAPAGSVLLALGDQPFLETDDLRALIEAHDGVNGAGGDHARITVPVRSEGEDRGNPILIPHSLRRTILEGGPRLGCRRLTRERPDLVHPWPTDRSGFFEDVDTPERYRALTGEEPCAV